MGERINKYLSSAGVCSRREADKLIEAGRVRIDEDIAVCGSRVEDGQKVYVDNQLINANNDRVFLVFNKPKGVVCTTGDGQGGISITDYINYPTRIFPIGRLDKESTGLIFLTNEGEISDKILRSRNNHEKEYEVTVDKGISDEFLKKMGQGVYIEELDRTTKPCEIERTGFKTFRIILTQGLNRQIRRMCATLGYKVIELKRVRIMNVEIGNLKEGTYRKITEQEYNELVSQL